MVSSVRGDGSTVPSPGPVEAAAAAMVNEIMVNDVEGRMTAPKKNNNNGKLSQSIERGSRIILL
jgi:hypothetical protein